MPAPMPVKKKVPKTIKIDLSKIPRDQLIACALILLGFIFIVIAFMLL